MSFIHCIFKKDQRHILWILLVGSFLCLPSVYAQSAQPVVVGGALISPAQNNEVLIYNYECIKKVGSNEAYSLNNNCDDIIKVNPNYNGESSRQLKELWINSLIKPGFVYDQGTEAPLGCFEVKVDQSEKLYCTDARYMSLKNWDGTQGSRVAYKENNIPVTQDFTEEEKYPSVYDYYNSKYYANWLKERTDKTSFESSSPLFVTHLETQQASPADLADSVNSPDAQKTQGADSSSQADQGADSASGDTNIKLPVSVPRPRARPENLVEKTEEAPPQVSTEVQELTDPEQEDVSSLVQNIPVPKPRPDINSESPTLGAAPALEDKVSRSLQNDISAVRPRAAPDRYSEVLEDVMEFSSRSDLIDVRQVKCADDYCKEKNIEETLESPIAQGAKFKLIPSSPVYEIEGQKYREVQYLNPERRNFRTYVLIPESEILDENGQAFTDQTPILKNDKKVVQSLAGEEVEPEEAKEQAQEKTEKQKDSVSTDQLQPENACANPEYIKALASSEPNCRLVPVDQLVFSSLEKGQVLIAQNRESKTCYKLSVDKETKTKNKRLDVAVAEYVKERRDAYEEIILKLKSKSQGQVKSGEPEVNRVTSSCLTNLNVCSISLGGLPLERLRHTRYEMQIPKRGLVSLVNEKVKIYGPSKEGLYLVKFLEGAKKDIEKEGFIVDNEGMTEIFGMMRDFNRDFPIKEKREDYHHALDLSGPQIELPVLRIEAAKNNEEPPQSKIISMDPHQPFKKLYEINQTHNYYNLECTKTYNPLKEEPSKWSRPLRSLKEVFGLGTR